jgi:hypothetical protein
MFGLAESVNFGVQVVHIWESDGHHGERIEQIQHVILEFLPPLSLGGKRF